MTFHARLEAVDTVLALTTDAVGAMAFLFLVGYVLFRWLTGSPFLRVDVFATAVFLLGGWMFSGLSLVDRTLRLMLSGTGASTRRLQELGLVVLVWSTTIAGVSMTFSTYPRAWWIYVWSVTSAGLHVGADLTCWWVERDGTVAAPTGNALAFALVSLVPLGHAWATGWDADNAVWASWAQLATMSLVLSVMPVMRPACAATRTLIHVAHWPHLLAVMQMGMTLLREIVV